SSEDASPDVLLQIGELLDARNVRNAAREALFSKRSSEGGDISELITFLKEDIRSSAWMYLLRSLKSDNDAERMMGQLSSVNTTILPDGRVRLNLDYLREVSFTQDEVERIQRLLTDEFGRFRDLMVSGRAEKSRVGELFPDLLARFNSATRQEQRTAIMVDALVRFPQYSGEILRRYNFDRASYALEARKNVGEIVGSMATHFSNYPLPKAVKEQLCMSVWRAYSRTVTRHRAWLLLELVDLSDDKDILNFVERTARRSRSYWMDHVLGVVQQGMRKGR
ncbi:MAG: hypothetical protein U1E15_08670, partial [Hyphomicrobiales bacterium]